MQTLNDAIQGTTTFRPSQFPHAEVYDVPLLIASEQTIAGYGFLIDDFESTKVEIVTWPQPGWRSVLPGTGNEGGITEGEFEMYWEDGMLKTENHAVKKSYITGWSQIPKRDSTLEKKNPDCIYTFEANYHPDGGQVFFPKEPVPFVALLALPTDDVLPSHFKAFYFDGQRGLHINPGVWHQPLFPCADTLTFKDKQGKVHACIACNTVEEFGVYLKIPLPRSRP